MVPDSLFDDDDDSTLPRDVIIKKFQQWWTAEQIEEMLKDHLISSKAFLENIKHQESDEFRLDHLQYATILYEQVGEKFLFTEKRKRYRFLPKVLKAVATEQPSNEKEINRMFVKYWPWVRDIPPYSDEVRLEEFLHTLRSMTSNKTFLKELVEIINLPPVCAQRAEKGPDRKTETIDPIGVLNPLYDFQNDVSYQIKDMLTNYDDKTSRGIVALPTGCGKTRLVVESILEWVNEGKQGQENKKFILWIVDRKELCDQAYDAFKAVFTAIGKQDTSLKLHVFYGSKTKNLTDTLEESLSESQSHTTSVIIASIGSLQSICSKQRNLSEEDSSLRDLGKNCALVVIDEAHHAIAPIYSQVLTGILDKNIKVKHNTGLGFNFMKNEKHPNHARLLGLTATPFRREHDDSFNTESERLRGRFGNNFLWPSLESSTLADEDNNPHAVMELQQSATVGMPVKITAERSFDQDGQIREFYWQINEVNPSAKSHRLYNDSPYYSGNQEEHTEKEIGVPKYDTGKKYDQEGTPAENFKNWVKSNYHSDKKEVVLHVKDDVFDKAGLYEVYLWVKDDDGLVCLEPDYRVIRINEKIKSSSVKDQSSLKLIYQKLMKAKVLAKPTRWILEHDSQKYLDREGIEVTYKQQFGKDSNEYSPDTLQAIAEETRLNEKILAVIKKLVEEEDKKSILLFANTVEHARLLSTLIRAVLHYNSEYVYAGTHVDERCKFIRHFRAKKITVLCNYDILTTGFDAPQVDAIVNTRLTGSYVLYTQMIGRGLRGPKNGGTDECVVVDFNPKLRKRIANMSEDQRLEAWKFHDELYVESKTLTDEDLNLPEYAAKIAELDEAKKTWESDGKIVSETLSNIEKLYQIFKEYPKLGQKSEYSKFLKYIQEKSVEFSVNALEGDPNFRIVEDEYGDKEKEISKWVSPASYDEQESEIFEKKLSYDDLMHFINNSMKTQANYQPVMISFLLTCPNKSATRREIAEQLKLVNIKPDTKDYEKVPVYGVLEGHNIVIREEGRSLSDDLFILNVEDLDEKQMEIVIEVLKKRIEQMEIRSEATRKANETRGPEGRSEATRKANETRNEFLDWVPAPDENDENIQEVIPQIWLYAITKENWDIVIEKEVWGTMTELRTNKLNNGDKMIFYVKETNELKGIFDVVSDWYESKELTWSEEKLKNEIVYPYQIKLSKVLLGNVIYKEIKDELDFVENKKHYNMYLQMHMTGPSNWGKPLNSHDYELIKSKMNANEIFEHTCPKCNEVSVKYHKPPTEEENELIEGSFGWRGDIIQSWCRLCRSPKIENKKPGFFSRFQKKKSKEELEEKYARETTPEVLKKAITEFKKGELYHRDMIRRKLDLGFSGGIRSSVKNNIVVLFWNALSDNVDQSDDGFAPNIYEDYFNAETGLYHYIGEGQIGDQTLDSGSGGNKRITKAKEQGRTIHLFHQHNKKEKHEYLGQVELVGITKERQADVERNDREVLVFLLKPV